LGGWVRVLSICWLDMGELTQAEVYSPRTQQVWRALLSWLAFFFQIFFQIIRALGHYPLLSFSSSSSSSSSSSFKPLPSVELVEHDSPPPSALEITAVDYSPADRPIQKLTVFTVPSLFYYFFYFLLFFCLLIFNWSEDEVVVDSSRV